MLDLRVAKRTGEVVVFDATPANQSKHSYSDQGACHKV